MEIDVTLLAISFPITTLVFHYIPKVVTIEINQSAFESYPHMSMRLGDVSYGDGPGENGTAARLEVSPDGVLRCTGAYHAYSFGCNHVSEVRGNGMSGL